MLLEILDIGCGSGIPTIELAKLSSGEIIGIDIDQSVLNQFNIKIEQEGFFQRIKTYNYSIYSTPFHNGQFDLIWEEGVLLVSFVSPARL